MIGYCLSSTSVIVYILSLQFEVGDQVRIKVDKNAQKIVKRSLTSNWSDKIYTITEVDDKQYPIMYKVKDSDNHLVRRKYYHFELLLVK